VRRDIVRTVTYRHPPALVWRALTDRDALAVWLMRNDFEPRVGHRFRFRTDPAPGFDGVVDCEVLELDPERLLRISWSGGPVDAQVTWRLEPLDLPAATDGATPAATGSGGTRLHFAMTGFAGPQAVLVSHILGAGFRGMYHRDLPAVLDRLAAGEHPGPARGEGECAPGRLARVRARLTGRLPRRRPAGSAG